MDTRKTNEIGVFRSNSHEKSKESHKEYNQLVEQQSGCYFLHSHLNKTQHMSNAAAIFGKALYDLTLDDLNHFFSESQEETSVLEFKSFEVSYESIYPEVAAFLNTEGGILILGTVKETSGQDAKTTIGNVVGCSKITSQDKLAQKIAANISLSPVGIKYHTVRSESGQSVYVLEIPQSTIPPHQVNDRGVYYIRLEREAKAAPQAWLRHCLINA